MLGIGAYDSDDEPACPPAEVPAPVAPVAPEPAELAAAVPAKEKVAKKDKVRSVQEKQKIAEIKKEIIAAKSATVVVQIVRASMAHWDINWGAFALYQVAKRSTARTRGEWATDKSVVRVANKLKAESAVDAIPSGKLSSADAEVVLLSLEALRRMAMQGQEEQRQCLEVMRARLAAAKYDYPAKTLTRLYWLVAPLKIEGLDAIPPEIRARAIELGGPDISLLLAALRLPGARDVALLEKVVGRLKEKDIHKNLSATDMVELSEGLAELGQRDEEAIRPLGQELQRRRGELTPDEAHRIQNSFQTLKVPLSQVWAAVGATKKRDGSQVVTTQAFAPQGGHEKKRRGSNDIERTSPPRVVRDYKMCSY